MKVRTNNELNPKIRNTDGGVFFMPKYTKEFKIKLVLEYLSGQTGGRPAIANKYNIPDSTLENWIIKYNSGGFDSLSKNLKNNKYTSEFKLSVIQYR